MIYYYRCQGISVKIRSGPATVIPDPASRDECFAKIMVTVPLKRYGKTGRTGKARKPACMSLSVFDPVVRVGSIPVLFLTISITNLHVLMKGIWLASFPIWERYFLHRISTFNRFLHSNSTAGSLSPSLRSSNTK